MKKPATILAVLAISATASTVSADTLNFGFEGLGGAFDISGSFEFDSTSLDSNSISGADITGFSFVESVNGAQIIDFSIADVLQTSTYSFSESNGVLSFNGISSGTGEANINGTLLFLSPTSVNGVLAAYTGQWTTATLTTASVPLPASALMLLGALGISGLAFRRKAA